MVQKYQSPVRIYKHPFEMVMAAYERRFPKCPQMPIVLDCEIIKDEILDNGARRNTSRRCKLAVDAPYLFKKIIGVDVVYFLQHNYLDLSKRTLNIEAVNETFSSRIEIFERCRYYSHPDNPDWTCFDQQATLDIKNFFGFENSMEKMGMKQYTQTTLKGKEIIEYFVNELKNEGVTHIERWKPPIGTIMNGTDNNDLINNGGDKNSNSNNDVVRRLSKTLSITSELGNDDDDDDNDDNYKNDMIMLDGDFILKNLGQLSPLQESKLLELRKLLIKENLMNNNSSNSNCNSNSNSNNDDNNDNKLPFYQTLLRFLRARDFNVEKSLHMLKDTIQWRQDNNVDKLLDEYKPPHVIQNYFPGGWHHFDKDGRPIYVLRLGHMDVKGLLKAIGGDGLLKLSIHICEEGIRLISESTKKLEKPVLNWCVLVDLDGLSMRHLWRPGIKTLLKIIETVEKHYPETMGRVLVVRAPRVFPIAWTIVSAFIDENTRSKFLFYGGPDCIHMKDGLEQYIDSDLIPEFLGGPCKTLIHEGGLIPKTLHKMNSEEDDADGGEINGGCDGGVGGGGVISGCGVGGGGSSIGGLHPNDHHNLYHKVQLKSGYIHEVVIKNNDPKSVITWDFDVLKSDIHFTLYRTTKDIPHKNDSTASFFDLAGFEEGKNYFREEPTIICHHKESVQGSHVMTTTDNYILHWFSPTTSSHGPAQLNYFYEILSSANYKGSMTSLQSGFSTTSLASSCQSR